MSYQIDDANQVVKRKIKVHNEITHALCIRFTMNLPGFADVLKQGKNVIIKESTFAHKPSF